MEKDQRPFFKNMLKSTFKTKVGNSEEISSPIVSAIRENTEAVKDKDVAKQMSKPIVTALVDVMGKLDEKKEYDDSKIDKIYSHIQSLKVEKILNDVDKVIKDVEDATPTRESLEALIKPLIPEPIPGKDGENYIITEKDKKEIAKSIKVPIVEKVIEHTIETIVEKQPIITNEIKEVAVTDKADIIKGKLESLEGDDRLDAKAIKGLPKASFGGGGIKRIDAANDTRIISPTNGQTLVWNSTRQVWENSTATGGSETFIGLTDVPASYSGEGTKFVRVNAGETALEFATISGGGDALTSAPLSQFAATTSLQLKGVMSDETGSGALVFAESPTLVTPALGTPASGVATNLTGTAAGLTAGNVTTNANLTGHVTSVGNAAVLGSFTKAQLDTAVSDGNVMYIGDAPTAHTHLLAAGATDVTASAAELNILDGATLTVTELNYVDGVTSAIQTQLDAKQASDADLTTLATAFSSASASGAASLAFHEDTDNGTNKITVVGAASVASDKTLTLPDATDTLVGKATTDTLTNKSVDLGTNTVTGTKAQFDTAVSDGNIMFDGDSIVNATATAHRVFYSDGSGVITELALGADGTFLKSNGAAVAPSFATPAGSGDVSKVGTPVNNQVGVWTGDGTLEGDASLTFDTTTDTLSVAASGKIAMGAVNIIDDTAGTTTLSNIDALDATTEATIEAAIDTLANLTAAAALNTINTAHTGVLRADAGVLSVDSDVTDIVAAGTSTAAGKLELATDAETVTGTDTARATTPANITAKMAAPGTIGGTTPGAATFTTLTATTVNAFTTGGNITLAENTSLDLDPAGSADGKYTGIAITGTAGEALAFGDVIVLDVTAGKWFKGSVSAAAAADGDLRGGVGMCVLAAAGDASATKILLMGTCRADANFPALTIGSVVYASTTGDITVTQPTTTDHIIKVLGFALSADEIMFNPSMNWITHT